MFITLMYVKCNVCEIEFMYNIDNYYCREKQYSIEQKMKNATTITNI